MEDATLACGSSTKKSRVCNWKKRRRLTKLSKAQAEYLNVPMDVPYKPEHYRY